MAKVIQTTPAQFLHRMTMWRRAGPKGVAIILNRMGVLIDKERREQLEKVIDPRDKRGYTYIYGKPKGNARHTNSTLFIYEAYLTRSRIKDVKVVMGAKKARGFMRAHEVGGSVERDDQFLRASTDGRGGNYAKRIKRDALLKKGVKHQKITRHNGVLDKKELHQFKVNLKPFWLDATTLKRPVRGKTRKEGGLYQFVRGELRLLRAAEKKPIKIKGSNWHSKAIDSVIHSGNTRHEVELILRQWFEAKDAKTFSRLGRRFFK